MTGTLSYRPEETGGAAAGEIAEHTTQATGRPISRFYRGQKTAVVVCLHDALYDGQIRFRSDSHRIQHLESGGSRNHPSNIIEKDRYGRRYGSTIPFHGRQMYHVIVVAAEQPLESEDIERMDWPARSPDLNPHRACMGFSRQTLGGSYYTTSNDSGASFGAARRDERSNASTTH
ncbi:hypothetical protein TNCV_2707231 [Trichonephila clavipes]|nr:hypothetical protein TNCV_2707231 [Trichonephila clavipes]